MYGTWDLGGLGWPSAHSWVELPGDITFDGTRMEFYRTKEYRRRLYVRPVRAYTGNETTRLVALTECTGPWTEEECHDILGYVPGPETSPDASH